MFDFANQCSIFISVVDDAQLLFKRVGRHWYADQWIRRHLWMEEEGKKDQATDETWHPIWEEFLCYKMSDTKSERQYVTRPTSQPFIQSRQICVPKKDEQSSHPTQLQVWDKK